MIMSHSSFFVGPHEFGPSPRPWAVYERHGFPAIIRAVSCYATQEEALAETHHAEERIAWIPRAARQAALMRRRETV